MPFDSERFHRHSQRLRGHDYAGVATYFVTIVAEHREQWFGSIIDNTMQLNTCGLMVDSWWCGLPRRYPAVAVDAYVVMPNHLHGIIRLQNSKMQDERDQDEQQNRENISLGRAIGWFKTVTTNDYMLGVKHYDWPQFDGRLWQRNYHDRVIRNGNELDHVRSYIASNPDRWLLDDENPANT